MASFKSQMKKADASGARFAIIVGADEVMQQKMMLKDLQGGEQTLLDITEVISRMNESRESTTNLSNSTKG